MLHQYKQKCHDQAVYICVNKIGQEICVVLLDGSDNENNEMDSMFIKSTVGIDDASSMILILFMNKSTDITDMQQDLFPLSLAQTFSMYQKQTAFRMFLVPVFSDNGKKFWYIIYDVMHVRTIVKRLYSKEKH